MTFLVLSLPTETILQILSYLLPQGLARVVRASNSFYDLALPLLYSEVNLENWNIAASCLLTISEKSDIAKHVLSLMLPPVDTLRAKGAENVLQSLSLSIRNAVNLKVFEQARNNIPLPHYLHFLKSLLERKEP